MQSLYTFFLVQLARIHDQLYPPTSYPIHTPGPRRPDLQEMERALLRKGDHAEED